MPVDSSPVCREPSVEQRATRPPGDKEGEGAAGAKQELEPAVFYPPTNTDKEAEYSDASSASEDSKYLETPKKDKNH